MCLLHVGMDAFADAEVADAELSAAFDMYEAAEADEADEADEAKELRTHHPVSVVTSNVQHPFFQRAQKAFGGGTLCG